MLGKVDMEKFKTSYYFISYYFLWHFKSPQKVSMFKSLFFNVNCQNENAWLKVFYLKFLILVLKWAILKWWFHIEAHGADTSNQCTRFLIAIDFEKVLSHVSASCASPWFLSLCYSHYCNLQRPLLSIFDIQTIFAFLHQTKIWKWSS